MVEMVSRRLQQQLLLPNGSQLCGAMREAILTLCRDNLTYGGQVEVDGIICITGPQDGQQLVVKVHELLDREKWLGKARSENGGGGNYSTAEYKQSEPHASPDDSRQTPSIPPVDTQSSLSTITIAPPVNQLPTEQESQIITKEKQENKAGNKEPQEYATEREIDEEPAVDREAMEKEVGMEMKEAEEQEGKHRGQQEQDKHQGLNATEHYLSKEFDSGQSLEVEALDLRLDSPAARSIKQEPMEYEESHRYHPYGSSSSSGSFYRPSSTQDLCQMDGGGIAGTSIRSSFDDRNLAADSGSGSRRASSSSPHTPHTPLLVPFMGPAHHPHPEMAETAALSAPHAASPFMDSRLRHLLAKMPYTKPHPGLPFLHRRPLFPTMSLLHSGAPECKACGFTFAQVELLKEHNEAVHAVFTCNVCYRTFTSRSNLDRHSRLHTGHKPYICVKCGKAFSRKDHLTNHSAKHAFKCGKCLKRFVEREALQGHYDQDHQVMLTNICEHCNKGFSDPAVYTEHLKSHPEYIGGTKIHPKHKPFACTECNYVCADKLQLLKHNQLHGESGKNLVFNCLACRESFDDPLLYSQHFEGHQEQTDIFECCICRKMCHTWHELKQHEQGHLHPSSRGPTLACPVCYIIFDNPDVLAEHMQSHDHMDIGDFPCNVCNEVFSSLEELQKHEQEEKHYVKKAFISPHHPMSSPLQPHDGPLSPRPSSTDRTILSSVCDSDSNDSDEELDVIAVDDSPPSESTGAIPSDKQLVNQEKEDQAKDFVVTDNPTSVIEVSNTKDGVESSPPVAPPVVTEPLNCRSHSSSSSSPASSLFASAMSSASVLPPAPPSAAVFPERSPIHPSMAMTPPPLPIPPPGSLASFVASHSPQPSPDPMSSAAAWFPPPFHNHNSTAYAFSAPLSEYPCTMCDAKLLSFHDYESHCFSDHFRYPCMYCSKTFAQKANRDRHVCIHTGEKPYSCPECDQKFARGDKLKIHRTKWHNIQFPSTYNRPKEGTGSGDWPSSRRKEGSDETGPGSQRDGGSGRWSDPEQQDPVMGDSHIQSSYIGMKVDSQASTSNINPN